MADKLLFYVIAGSNGSGKSTYTKNIGYPFPVIDPDAIAKELNPDNPKAAALSAGKEARRRLNEAFENKQSIAIETTLSGMTTLNDMTRARELGYKVHLIYFSVGDWQTARSRVNMRVHAGGHDIPTEDLKRRFVRSFSTLPAAAIAADHVQFHDNAGLETAGIVATKDRHQPIKFIRSNPPRWLQELALILNAQSIRDPGR